MSWILSCVLALALTGGALGAGDIVARIGDKEISVAQFERQALELRKSGYRHIREFDAPGKRELLDGLIARELLVLEALRRGYERDPDIARAVAKARRRALIKKLYEEEAVRDEYVFSDEELRAFFHQRQYDTEVLSQHIVCDSLDKAEEVLAALREGTPFEALVELYSLPSIQHRFGPRGWVGWFKIGEVFEELRQPMLAMEPGTVYPEPVRTAIGYHVFRLRQRRPVDFAAARAWVEEQARIQSRADDMERYIEQLRQRYELTLEPETFAALRQLPAAATEWPGEDRVLFRWKGGRLTARDYMREVGLGSARHPAQLDSAGLHRDADNLAGKQIMMAEAHRLGLDDDADIRAEVERRRDKLVVEKLYRVETRKRAQPVGEEEIEAFYQRHLDEFRRADGQVTALSFLRKSIGALLRERARSRAMDELLAELREAYAEQIEIYPQALDLAFAGGR